MDKLIKDIILDNYEIKWLYNLLYDNYNKEFTIIEDILVDNEIKKVKFVIGKHENEYYQKNIEVIS